ncbi:tol-pal system-associated acyl-CoA thioesterase [Lonsdalea quercina]|uniref:tol-pal system-associated acyl-CoA thioesterase n=1 Tax=Lonsdalea quercina TaxID=71657 RepID=UPI0009DFB087
MNTADIKGKQQVSSAWRTIGGAFGAVYRSLLALLLVAGFSGYAFAAPSSLPLSTDGGDSAATSPLSLPPGSESAAPGNLMQMDLSVLGMYQHADIVVKIVMIGLILASVVTWAIFFGKSAELIGAKRRLRREHDALSNVRSLDEAAEMARLCKKGSVAQQFVADAQDEILLSARSDDNQGIKERTAFRFERRVAANGRHMSRGTGYLATVGAIAPFIGLFGTVWGIMNSFIGIAHTQTTNLAVVAPGIAEALLATAIGLIAAIPAVVIYNVFARSTTSYKALVGDVAAQVLLLQSRDLDIAASESSAAASSTQKLRAG